MTTATRTDHRETLERALTAIRERTYWSAYPENLKAYGEETGSQSAADGQGRVRRLPGQAVPARAGRHRRRRSTGERSPYGLDLGITYPHAAPRRAARPPPPPRIPAWRDAGPDARAELGLEILHRINARSHEMAQAVMHTSGQAYAMAFQAGGPHAQDRALEASPTPTRR